MTPCMNDASAITTPVEIREPNGDSASHLRTSALDPADQLGLIERPQLLGMSMATVFVMSHVPQTPYLSLMSLSPFR